MSDLIRDAPLGQIIRYVTKNKYLQYPEEKPDFECPDCYARPDISLADEPATSPLQSTVVNGDGAPTPSSNEPDEIQLEKAQTAKDTQGDLDRVASRVALSRSKTREDLERHVTAATMRGAPSRPIAPSRLDDGTVLVDWYTTDDPSNPTNWSTGKKFLVSAIVCTYTTAVYMGSAIYAPSELGVIEEFGVSLQVAALGLSMYVLAYGIGPMLWSPLSEIPAIGRNPPYMATFAIFVILLVPTALADNMPGLVILRFLLGFFGSPCLATGGASLGDMFTIVKLPYALSMWALSATMGPALGPLISGFSVTAENWRWSQWEILWLAGPMWLVMFFFLPETSSGNVLLRRAKRLRQLTGDHRLKAQSEIDQANMSPRQIAVENLWRPMQMIILDPAVGFTAIYTALLYGIYYSFFEAFPEVFIGYYGFNLGEQGLAFLSITVGVALSVVIYWTYVWFVVEPDFYKNGLGAPERRLIPALYATFLCPIGLFIFAWTAKPDIHWIVPIIGIGIFTVGIFIVIQCIFVFLPLTYPMYAASLFAGNDLMRSTLAAGAIHFSSPLFSNLGVDVGVSILGACTALCCGGVYILYFFGDKLRARSRFAAK